MTKFSVYSSSCYYHYYNSLKLGLVYRMKVLIRLGRNEKSASSREQEKFKIEEWNRPNHDFASHLSINTLTYLIVQIYTMICEHTGYM